MNIKKFIQTLPEIYIQKSRNLTFSFNGFSVISELKRVINLIKIMNYYYIDSLNENKYKMLEYFLDIELYDKNNKKFLDEFKKLLSKHKSSEESEEQEEEIFDDEEEKDDFDDAENFDEFDIENLDFVTPEDEEENKLEPNNPLHFDFVEKKEKRRKKKKKKKRKKKEEKEETIRKERLEKERLEKERLEKERLEKEQKGND